MNKCPRCGYELIVERDDGEGDVVKILKKCQNCGFEDVHYMTGD